MALLLGSSHVRCAAAAQVQTDRQATLGRGTVPARRPAAVRPGHFAGSAPSWSGGTSPVAARVELHEMAMDGDVMQMRAVPALELPAGKARRTQARRQHVMLIGLKQPLKVGEPRCR